MVSLYNPVKSARYSFTYHKAGKQKSTFSGMRSRDHFFVPVQYIQQQALNISGIFVKGFRKSSAENLGNFQKLSKRFDILRDLFGSFQNDRKRFDRFCMESLHATQDENSSWGFLLVDSKPD